MKNIHIEVIASDNTELASLGIGSLANCHSVYRALAENYKYVGFNIVKTRRDLDFIIKKKPDLVFSGIRYLRSDINDITTEKNSHLWVSEYMENAGVNYTGSTRPSLELERNKYQAKKAVEIHGISTAPYFLGISGRYQEAVQLPLIFPMFVKPVCESDSQGIGADSVVHNFDDYQKKVTSINAIFQEPSLVEKLIVGREFTVAIFDDSSIGELIAMPVEIIVPPQASGTKILDYQTKKDNQEKVISVSDSDIYEGVTTLAKQAFKALRGRDFGRIDILMDADGYPYFMEANFMPGMTKRSRDIDCSYFPRACFINAEMTYQETVCKMAELALSRSISRASALL